MFRLMELMELDLSSVASVCKFADDILMYGTHTSSSNDVATSTAPPPVKLSEPKKSMLMDDC